MEKDILPNPLNDVLPNPPNDPAMRDPVECPACGESTMPNLLSDGSYVCSCPAQRALPMPQATAGATVSPPPVDDASFSSSGSTEHPMPPGGEKMATPEDASVKRENLPGDQGQFGTDTASERYRRLDDPPGR